MIFKKKEKKDIKTHIKSYDLILNPIITEKATTLSSFSQVVLSVPFDSNKKQIKNSVESLFGVSVKKINIVITKGKTKRFKGKMGKRKNTKKAIIFLEKDQKIDITTGV